MSFHKMADLRSSETNSVSNFNGVCDIKEENEFLYILKLKEELKLLSRIISVKILFIYCKKIWMLVMMLAQKVQGKPIQFMT